MYSFKIYLYLTLHPSLTNKNKKFIIHIKKEILFISNKPKKNLEIIGSVIYEYDWANKTMRFWFINI